MANPVVEAIMAGHYQKELQDEKTKKTRFICRICADDMPCSVILAARAQARRIYGTLRPAKAPKTP